MTDTAEIDLTMTDATPSRSLDKSLTTMKKDHVSHTLEKKILDPKITKHTAKSWWTNFYVVVNTAFTQKWMDVAAEHTQTNVKKSLYDVNAQLALVSSLVLTMVFPLMYEFVINWYELAMTGVVATRGEHYFGINLFREEYMGIWHDISLWGYNMGMALMICAVVACLIQLIVINEITEEQAITYTRSLGPVAKKFSFRAMVCGLIVPMVGPMLLRIFATQQTIFGFFFWASTGLPVLYVAFTIYRTVKALYICVEESESYDEIALTEAECMAMCKKYFDKFPDTYTLQGYTKCLMVVTPRSFKIQLTYPTKVRALKCFYQELCDREGFSINHQTLSKLCAEGAANFPVDHKGQEYAMGDDITDLDQARSIVQMPDGSYRKVNAFKAIIRIQCPAFMLSLRSRLNQHRCARAVASQNNLCLGPNNRCEYLRIRGMYR